MRVRGRTEMPEPDQMADLRERLVRIETIVTNGLQDRITRMGRRFDGLEKRTWALVIMVSLQLLGTAALGLLLRGGG